jgi:WhiB family redox-sensing transcriptional regulator
MRSPFADLVVPEFMAGTARAVCADEDPELWFPISDDTEAIEQAKSLCAACPLLRPCTAWALTHAVHGVWGGLTESDRARLQRQHGLPKRVQWSSNEPAAIRRERDEDVESEES